MASEPVHPLRISKSSTLTGSPTKKPASTPRPLSEISPSEKRINSPSWNQTTKKMGLNSDSSPFQSSPLDGTTTSPRVFWQNRGGSNSENAYAGNSSGSPTRRSSIERLQKASRVKNSSILAQEQKNEYDPTKVPLIERPLSKVQSNAYGGLGIAGLRTSADAKAAHQRAGSKTDNYNYVFSTPTRGSAQAAQSAPVAAGSLSSSTRSQPPSPSKDQSSPKKSSLSSRYKNSYSEHSDLDLHGSLSEHELPEGRSLHRHAKSVTFDAAPPQVNEYEMATPDLSSVGSNSREGSFESEEEDDDYDDYHFSGTGGVGQDDSFDASLEDTIKTPVVGPDDWRHDSPGGGRHSAGFDGSPTSESLGSSGLSHDVKASPAGSTSEHRPLPPLPGMGQARRHSGSSAGYSPSAERILGGSPRNLPTPPKADFQAIGTGKMTLEERLKLMMLSDDGKSAAEQQRERRMRRAGARDRSNSHMSDVDASHLEADDSHSHLEVEESKEAADHVELTEPTEPAENKEQKEKKEQKEQTEQMPEAPEEEIDEHNETVEVHKPVAEPVEHKEVEAAEPGHLDEEVHNNDADDTIGDISGLEEYRLPPRISRESILRRANASLNVRESDYNFSSPMASPNPDRGGFMLDPDVPIPSTEQDEDSLLKEHDGDVKDDEFGGSDVYENEDLDDFDDDSELDSLYTDSEGEEDEKEKSVEADATSTPKPSPKPSPIQETSSHVVKEADIHSPALPPTDKDGGRLSLDMLKASSTHEAKLRNTPVLSPPTERPETPVKNIPLSKPEYDGTGWGDDNEFESEPRTPDSVIHHPIEDSEDEYEEEEEEVKEEVAAAAPAEAKAEGSAEPEEQHEQVALDSPAIPEQVATIKASGSRLKTRPSATPSDIEAMRQARRQVSREVLQMVPPIPSRHRDRLSRDLNDGQLDTDGDEFLERHPSFKNRSLTLDLDLGLSLDKDFDRVIEAQKRGYLMRQNTKLVAASDKDGEDVRGARSAGNSPIKKDRPQSWTVEPWNGQTKKRSLRKRTAAMGPMPPLPGLESNAATLNPLVEEDNTGDVPTATDEGAERGRLFVKVMGVKDLDLPIPRMERTWFSLTLDNGVHCVTTAWLELARNAPIGQEFELLVPNELEFQLTLNVKLEKPVVVKKVAPSPIKAVRPKTSTFSRVFASPKKRKEMEQRMREEEERLEREQREALAKLKRAEQPSAYDLLSPIVAEDGSFARAYVCLKEHESRCFGRPGVVEVACFNEWATEEAGFASSVKSKRGNVAVVRKAPYKIGKLELQLLFVPRPKGVTNEDMPKSMNSCIREMKAAEERLSRNWEGHLSQQGGDCPYWRRRYFKLVGTKLTAYHEATRQPRATINLANARRLIDDRRVLTEKETLGRNGRRRRSAFAEDEEGYMFVEEGFRIRFNNGELIDFYADTAEDKAGWMKVLSDVIARDNICDDDMGSRGKSKWCDVVLKREETLRRRAEGRRVTSRTKSMYV